MRGLRLGLGMTGGGPRFDYYVDSVNGSDSNSGTSAASAFQNLTAVPTLTQGKRLGLARGSNWRQKIAITATNCTIAAYGSGAAPIIDGSDPVSSGSWSLAATTTKTYQASVTIDTIGGASYFLNVWENGKFLTRATSLANCDATAGSYWFSSEAGGTITLYVHPTGDTNPGTNGKTYEFSARDTCLLADKANTTVSGIETKRSLNFNGSLWVGDNSTVTNCIARDGSKHNMFVRQGSTVSGCTATNGYYGTGSAALFCHFNDIATGGVVTYNNCTASNDAASALVGGFIGHIGTSGTFGTTTFNGCSVTNCSTAYNAGATARVDVINCTSTGCSGAVAAQTAIVNITGGTHDCTGPTISVTSASVTVNISGNASLSSGSGQSVIRSLVSGTTLNVTNCSFPKFGGWMIQCTGTGSSLTASGNTYNSSIGFFGYYDLPANFTLNSDNNVFGIAAHNSARINGTTYTSLSAYVTATGQDTHSTALA